MISKDPLLRYSRVLSGIVHKHVVVCEADTDCFFYSSIMGLPEIGGSNTADVLFVHANGKRRAKQLVSISKNLGVSVSVIVDIDILREEDTFRYLLESIGGSWSEIKNDWKILKNAIDDKTKIVDENDKSSHRK